MTQAKVITISEAAAILYIQAEISELAAIVAYAFDTLTFEKEEYHHYNILAVDTLKLSLSTMRNRATAARGLQVKYGAKIAGYVDGLTQETGNDFGTFLKSEMSLAGNFHRHSEDIGNFLAGKKPAHVQRQEAKDAAAEVKRIKDETAKRRADKAAADKAARDADTSGTVDAEAAVVPEKGTEVGHAENAPSVPVADMLPVVSEGVEGMTGIVDLQVALMQVVVDRDAAQAAHDADTSGTVDAEAAVVPEKGTVIGHAADAESVTVADMLPVVSEGVEGMTGIVDLQVALMQVVVDRDAAQSAFEAYQAATLIRVSETADGIEIDAEKCDTETLGAVIKELQGVVKARKAELKELLKKAA